MKKTLEKLLSIGRAVKEAAYWTTYYTVGFSSMNGLGNGLANEHQGESFSDGFGEAYVNNFLPGLAINSIYPVAHKLMQKTDHYRLYANLFNLGVGATFLALHTYLGTENPLPAVIPSVAIGAAMTNRQVTEVQQSLENEL
tara:strand:+ start:237 stop:659 length:423 start_codon:yes stop_codon:yes gene_type:complete